MATVKAVDIIDRAGQILNDTGFVQWTKLELLGYLNDAQRQIALHRPDASSTSASFTTAEGTKQDLPGPALRLIDVVRNTGGKVITQVSRQILDEHLPDWHETPAAGATEAEHFTYDPRDPKVFYLYPKMQAGQSVELVYSVAPEEIVSAQADLSDIPSETISIDDVFMGPVLDFVLWRAFSKDTEFAGNIQRAQVHMQAFASALGVKLQMDSAVSPSPRNPDAAGGRS
jgi:hypothetical protein